MYAWQPGHKARNLSRSAGGLLLVSALISGLLNFPSTCHCGAEMPHPHSLFLLADHHHHRDGTLEDEHEHEHEHEPGEAVLGRSEIVTRGPVVQAATPEGAFGEQISLTVEELGSAAWAGASERVVWPLHVPLAGVGEPPELPPPRSQARIL